METTQAVPDWKAAADEIWAMLRESRKEAEERQKEAEKRQKEWRREAEERRKAAEKRQEEWRKAAEKRQEEWRREAEKRRKEAEERRKVADREIREIRELQAETARQMKETDRRLEKQIGSLGNRFGEIVEYMVAPNLKAKFREIGLSFQETSNNRVMEDDQGKLFFEVDIMLENGDKALLVEAKAKPTTEDVNVHLERLGKMRAWADRKGDGRKFLGAIAGAVMTRTVRDYVLKQGLFAIEPSGETFNITQPPGRAREW